MSQNRRKKIVQRGSDQKKPNHVRRCKLFDTHSNRNKVVGAIRTGVEIDFVPRARLWCAVLNNSKIVTCLDDVYRSCYIGSFDLATLCVLQTKGTHIFIDIFE